MKIKNERAANMALAASIGAASIIHRPRGNAAYRRRQAAQRRRAWISDAAGGAAFIVLFAACFSPLFF